jgi:hypothetical protein
MEGSHGSSPERGKRRGEGGGQGGGVRLVGARGALQGGTMWMAAWSSGLPLRVRALYLLRAVCRKKRRKKKGEEKKEGKYKKKGKNMENFPNLKISEK